MSVADASTVEARRVGLLRLEGDVTFVTGASGGLGSSIAEAFALEGADVVCAHATADEREEALKTVAAVEAAGRRALLVECDVSSEESVVAAMAAVEVEFGNLDVLVAVAGIGRMAPFLETKTADFKAVHDVVSKVSCPAVDSS